MLHITEQYGKVTIVTLDDGRKFPMRTYRYNLMAENLTANELETRLRELAAQKARFRLTKA